MGANRWVHKLGGKRKAYYICDIKATEMRLNGINVVPVL